MQYTSTKREREVNFRERITSLVPCAPRARGPLSRGSYIFPGCDGIRPRRPRGSESKWEISGAASYRNCWTAESGHGWTFLSQYLSVATHEPQRSIDRTIAHEATFTLIEVRPVAHSPPRPPAVHQRCQKLEIMVAPPRRAPRAPSPSNLPRSLDPR